MLNYFQEFIKEEKWKKNILVLLDNVISESQVRWYNSYWRLQPGESRYKIGKGTGLDQIFNTVFVGKGNLFCKKSYKLYLWIKQEKNSILINIRWSLHSHFWRYKREICYLFLFCFDSQWVTDWFNNGLPSFVDR